jgi:hypothetical protein
VLWVLFLPALYFQTGEQAAVQHPDRSIRAVDKMLRCQCFSPRISFSPFGSVVDDDARLVESQIRPSSACITEEMNWLGSSLLFW